MENENPVESTEATKARKVVERSAAYPSINIEEAIAFIQSVVKSFPKEGTLINRVDIATVLKKGSPASVQRDVSSCAQYGLFIKNKDGGYQISSSAKSLSNQFLPEKEKKKLMLECFKSPKLYRDLITDYDNHALPPELAYILTKNHEIAEKAAPDAVNIFLANAASCGVLKDSILRVDEASNGIPYAEVIDPEKPNGTIVDVTPKQQQQTFLPSSPQPNQEQEHIKLGKERNVFISYPDDISRKELEIIRRHLAIIEFRISETESV